MNLNYLPSLQDLILTLLGFLVLLVIALWGFRRADREAATKAAEDRGAQAEVLKGLVKKVADEFGGNSGGVRQELNAHVEAFRGFAEEQRKANDEFRGDIKQLVITSTQSATTIKDLVKKI